MTQPPTESGEGDPGQVTRIAEEFIRLHEAGQLRDLDEFCARYPESQRDSVRQECEQLLRIQGVIKHPGRLTPGQTLASYEIIESIGKGGMGEVYRARDPKLDRDIAIKVLPPELASQPERVSPSHEAATTAPWRRSPGLPCRYSHRHRVSAAPALANPKQRNKPILPELAWNHRFQSWPQPLAHPANLEKRNKPNFAQPP